MNMKGQTARWLSILVDRDSEITVRDSDWYRSGEHTAHFLASRGGKRTYLTDLSIQDYREATASSGVVSNFMCRPWLLQNWLAPSAIVCRMGAAARLHPSVRKCM
jgi:hypothetical protein